VLNSTFTNWLLKVAVSKGGLVVRWAVGYIIAAIAAKHIVPEGDLTQIQGGLESGGYAVVALAYGGLQWWINERRKDGNKVVQTMLNAQLPSGAPSVPVDGAIGNKTIAAASVVTSVPVSHAIAAVTGKP
jgi:lysozyme family protein